HQPAAERLGPAGLQGGADRVEVAAAVLDLDLLGHGRILPPPAPAGKPSARNWRTNARGAVAAGGGPAALATAGASGTILRWTSSTFATSASLLTLTTARAPWPTGCSCWQGRSRRARCATRFS